LIPKGECMPERLLIFVSHIALNSLFSREAHLAHGLSQHVDMIRMMMPSNRFATASFEDQKCRLLAERTALRPGASSFLWSHVSPDFVCSIMVKNPLIYPIIAIRSLRHDRNAIR